MFKPYELDVELERMMQVEEPEGLEVGDPDDPYYYERYDDDEE